MVIFKFHYFFYIYLLSVYYMVDFAIYLFISVWTYGFLYYSVGYDLLLSLSLLIQYCPRLCQWGQAVSV